ncbi:Potassium/sodium hyperpolarization-activated cyclic nucleotide-gated channel 4, partial [Tetrabaena socialis]
MARNSTTGMARNSATGMSSRASRADGRSFIKGGMAETETKEPRPSLARPSTDAKVRPSTDGKLRPSTDGKRASVTSRMPRRSSGVVSDRVGEEGGADAPADIDVETVLDAAMEAAGKGAGGTGPRAGPTMAMVREAHEQLQRRKAVDGGGEEEVEGQPAMRRQDAGADSYMLRIFGSAYTKVAGTGEHGDSGALKVWLHPYASLRMRLDMLWIVVAILNAVVMPLQPHDRPNTRSCAGTAARCCAIRPLSCTWCRPCAGYDEEGLIVMYAGMVRSRYCRTYLLVDLIGALPYSLISVLVCGSVDAGVPGGNLGNCSDHGGLLLRLWALLSLASLPRLLYYLNKWQDTWDTDIHMMRLIKLMGLMMIFTHLFACLSYFVQMVEKFPMDGWVVSGGLDDKSVWITYNFALLRALQVVIGSNVDVVSASSSVEVVFTICCYLVGVVCYAVLVGIMSTIVLSLNRSGQMYVEKLQVRSAYNATLRANRAYSERSGSDSYDDEDDEEYDEYDYSTQHTDNGGSSNAQLSSGEDDEYEDLLGEEASGTADRAAGSSGAGTRAAWAEGRNEPVRSSLHPGAGSGGVVLVLPGAAEGGEGPGAPAAARMLRQGGGGGAGGGSLLRRALAQAGSATADAGDADDSALVTPLGDPDLPSADSMGGNSSSAAAARRSVKFAARVPATPEAPGGSASASPTATAPQQHHAPSRLASLTPAGDAAVAAHHADVVTPGPTQAAGAAAAPPPAADLLVTRLGSVSSRGGSGSGGSGVRSPRAADGSASQSATHAGAAAASAMMSAAGMLLSALQGAGGGGGGGGAVGRSRNRIVPRAESVASQDTHSESSFLAGGAGEEQQQEATSPIGHGARPAAPWAAGLGRLSITHRVASAISTAPRHPPPASQPAGGAGGSAAAAAGGGQPGHGGGVAHPSPSRGGSRLRNLGSMKSLASVVPLPSVPANTVDFADVLVDGSAGGGMSVSGAAAADADADATAQLASSVPVLARMRKIPDVLSFLKAVSKGGSHGGGGAASRSKSRPGSALGPPPAAVLVRTASILPGAQDVHADGNDAAVPNRMASILALGATDLHAPSNLQRSRNERDGPRQGGASPLAGRSYDGRMSQSGQGHAGAPSPGPQRSGSGAASLWQRLLHSRSDKEAEPGWEPDEGGRAGGGMPRMDLRRKSVAGRDKSFRAAAAAVVANNRATAALDLESGAGLSQISGPAHIAVAALRVASISGGIGGPGARLASITGGSALRLPGVPSPQAAGNLGGASTSGG